MTDDHRSLLLARCREAYGAYRRACDRVTLMQARDEGRICALDYEQRVRVLQVQERHAGDVQRLLDLWGAEMDASAVLWQ